MGIIYELSGGVVTFEANEIGARGTRAKGFDYGRHRLPSRHAYWMDYWIKPLPGWVEGMGYKLLGFGGGRATSGGREIHPEGWSSRMMGGERKGLRSYLYHQNRQGKYGDNDEFRHTDRFPVSEWTRVTHYVKVNGRGQPDGEARFWLDGREELRLGNLVLRAPGLPRETARVDLLFAQPFRGGNTEAWEVDKDTHLRFSNVYVLDCAPDLTVGDPESEPVCQGEHPPSDDTIEIIPGVEAVVRDDAVTIHIERGRSL